MSHLQAPSKPFFLLLVVVLPLVIWLYWSGTAGPLMFDDYSSVIPASLQAKPEATWQEAVFGDRAGPLGRPVSMLTFFVEQRFFGIAPADAKATNVALHGLNGILVFCLARLLIRTREPRRAGWIALVMTMAWLVAPIHVSTVLYLVQRMAMLAAFFVLLAMVLYAWGRRLQQLGTATWWLPLGFSLPMVICGMLAKENAVVGFPAILLLECMVFRFQGFAPKVASLVRRACITLFFAGIGVAALLILLNWHTLERSYELRPFSLSERLLTQLRVLWDYVAQIVFPEVTRMGIHHDDVIISTSLVQPASTLLAALSWCLVLAGLTAIVHYKRVGLSAFGICFFLIAHALESSIIPLELYYEHRNYLPSVGLFLTIAALAAWLSGRLEGAATPVFLAGLLYAGFLFFSTSSQVRIWSNPSLLVINTVNAHPDSPRANVDMSVHLARNGAYRLARDYSKRSYITNDNERWVDYRLRDMILACYANRSVAAIEPADIPEAERPRPIGDVHTLSVLVELVIDGGCESLNVYGLVDFLAKTFIDEGASATASALVYSRLAALENVLERYEHAQRYAARYLAQSPDNVTALLMQLHFASMLGRREDALGLQVRLWQMQRQGNLSQSEENTLKLYGPEGATDK